MGTIRQICDCGKELIWDGVCKLIYPRLYSHRCENDHVEFLDDIYPKSVDEYEMEK